MYHYPDCVWWDQRILSSFMLLPCCYKNYANTSETQNYYNLVKTIPTGHIKINKYKGKKKKKAYKAMDKWQLVLDNVIIFYSVMLLHMSSWSLCLTREILNMCTVFRHRLRDTMQEDVLSGRCAFKSFSMYFHTKSNTPGKNWNDPLHLCSTAGFTDAYLVSLTHLQRCICACCTYTIW